MNCVYLRNCEFEALACGQSRIYRPKSSYQTFLFDTHRDVEFVLQLQLGLPNSSRILGTCDELLRPMLMLKQHFNNQTSWRALVSNKRVNKLPGALRALLCGRDGRAAESQHVAQRRSTKNAIFNCRSKSTSCALSALRLSQNSNFQR